MSFLQVCWLFYKEIILYFIEILITTFTTYFLCIQKAEEPKLDSHLQNVVNMAEGRVQWWLNKLDQGTKRDEYDF